MDTTIFLWVFSITMGGMLLFIFLNLETLPVVKAGKVDKLCKKTHNTLNVFAKTICVNGKDIDIQHFEKMFVNGDSMKEYRIYNGQYVFVEKYTDKEKAEIEKYPVLVFSIIDSPNKNDAQFKLRKFVGYIKTDNWDEVYDTFKNRIKIDKDIFISQCEHKYNKISDKTSLVLSETYDETSKSVTYSLHPANSIYGRVRYAL